MRLLARLLRGFIKTGTLELTDAHGRKYLFGAAPGPAVVARIHDSALHTRLALNPELAAAEAYMDGTLTFEGGSTAHDLLLLFSVNRSALGAVASQKLLRRAWRAMRRRHQANTAARATDNARSHYDVPVGVYRLFLDAGLNYSCAFFHDPETDTLEQAQEAKLARATAKLGLRPGMRVAEIGSGWGSFAVHIAKSTGARVTAINVSPEQLAVSRMLAEREGVTDLVEFLELDYRALEGRFDRVVSVGGGGRRTASLANLNAPRRAGRRLRPHPPQVPNRPASTAEEMALHDRLWRSASLMAPCNLRSFLGV
jgi:cyclopropane-fatty-acyl-phospholipid synthase